MFKLNQKNAILHLIGTNKRRKQGLKVTDDSINRAIAEDLGWKWYRRPATGPWAKKPMRSLYHPQIHAEYVATLQPADMTERECNWTFIQREGLVQNYLDEKNPGPAHELIEVLRSEGWFITVYFLESAMVEVEIKNYDGGKQYVSCSTTFCRAVCECFLKGRGKWKDTT